jgi:hypothetical protein
VLREDFIDGEAHDGSANQSSGEVPLGQSLRAEVDCVLEEIRDHLEPVVYGLFVDTGAGWRERLNAARWERRGDLPPIDGGENALHDRRVLFSVLAYDWTLIGDAFMRDPSAAARRLCAIANRYAYEGPSERDAAEVRQAFGEICAALRRQSVANASWLIKSAR